MPAAAPKPYSPTDPMSYQAPVMPEPMPAMPSPLPTQGPEINGAVKTSGAIATMADSILRGFMNGRAMHQASQVMQLKKKSDDLQNSYNQDAVRLYQLHQVGADTSQDPETKKQYLAAKSSVDGSWGALMDFYGQHIAPQGDGKKKSKAKQVEGGIIGALQSKDPMQQSQAWYQLAQKAGPPVYGQIAVSKAQRQSPQGQLATTTTADRQTQTDNQTEIDNAKSVLLKYPNLTDDQLGTLPPDQQKQVTHARDVIAQANQLTATGKPTRPGDGARIAADAVFSKMSDPNYVLTDSDKLTLRLAKYPVDSKSKVTLNSKTGEIIATSDDGTFKVLRPAQYSPNSGRDDKPATKGQIAALTEKTAGNYRKAQADHDKKVLDAQKAYSGTMTDETGKLIPKISEEEYQARIDDADYERGVAFQSIGEENSQAMRDLGLTPAEDAQKHSTAPPAEGEDKDVPKDSIAVILDPEKGNVDGNVGYVKKDNLAAFLKKYPKAKVE